MDFKNIKSLSKDELDEYKKELVKEYSKIKKKVEDLCEKIREINDEYIDTETEIENRKKILKNE